MHVDYPIDSKASRQTLSGCRKICTQLLTIPNKAWCTDSSRLGTVVLRGRSENGYGQPEVYTIPKPASPVRGVATTIHNHIYLLNSTHQVLKSLICYI
jgi:hypothetical protein